MLKRQVGIIRRPDLIWRLAAELYLVLASSGGTRSYGGFAWACQSQRHSWPDTDLANYLIDLIDHYQIDGSRLYLTLKQDVIAHETNAVTLANRA